MCTGEDCAVDGGLRRRQIHHHRNRAGVGLHTATAVSDDRLEDIEPFRRGRPGLRPGGLGNGAAGVEAEEGRPVQRYVEALDTGIGIGGATHRGRGQAAENRICRRGEDGAIQHRRGVVRRANVGQARILIRHRRVDGNLCHSDAISGVAKLGDGDGQVTHPQVEVPINGRIDGEFAVPLIGGNVVIACQQGDTVTGIEFEKGVGIAAGRHRGAEAIAQAATQGDDIPIFVRRRMEVTVG